MSVHTASLQAQFEAIEAALVDANRQIADRYPGDLPSRQPVHTVYGGAHLFTANIAQKLGASALEMLREYAPDAAALSDAFELALPITSRIYPALVSKLTREPVEDFRIDFEDGFGNRSDEEEDRYASSVGELLAAGIIGGTLPFSIGIRIKPLNEELKRRALRTLAMVVGGLTDRARDQLASVFLVTLPKVTSPAQVAALASACDLLERAHRLRAGTLRIELMVETTQAIFAADGTIALPHLIAAAAGRIVAAHFGTYDYTAACGITAAEQHMMHPACDFAKQVMQVALAGTGVWLSDGATNIMPVPPHRPRNAGNARTGDPQYSEGLLSPQSQSSGGLTDNERQENIDAVRRAWRLQMNHIRHSLSTGFYQGWDLHPAQLPARYATVYAFFLEGLVAAAERLRNFVDRAAQATLVGEVFDDAATGQALLNYFLRAVNCGAITEAEASELTGLRLEELRGRSFVAILSRRRHEP